ncbi:splicing factor 3B subunit 2-like [Heteronotia binoei]|uniref:splicing factor 3B subunit 2-like n=1 Tax=Heteronotia binoei TaxID=13085 RepID=UPI0029313164|nr:splicing factor 3B subunit 2-like [Heteronotia binoei]
MNQEAEGRLYSDISLNIFQAAIRDTRPQGLPRGGIPVGSSIGLPGPRPQGPLPPPGEDSCEIDDYGVGPKIPQPLEKSLQLKEMQQGELTCRWPQLVTEEPEIYDPNFIFFKRIFEAFKLIDDVKKDKEKDK